MNWTTDVNQARVRVFVDLATALVAVNSHIAIFANTTRLTARDALTGAIRWTSSDLSSVSVESDPVVAGGVVYLATSNGTDATLRTFNASTGAAIASLNIAALGPGRSISAPVVSNGRVYVNENDTIPAYAP